MVQRIRVDEYVPRVLSIQDQDRIATHEEQRIQRLPRGGLVASALTDDLRQVDALPALCRRHWPA
jgi:hypothetical protein